MDFSTFLIFLMHVTTTTLSCNSLGAKFSEEYFGSSMDSKDAAWYKTLGAQLLR